MSGTVRQAVVSHSQLCSHVTPPALKHVFRRVRPARRVCAAFRVYVKRQRCWPPNVVHALNGCVNV